MTDRDGMRPGYFGAALDLELYYARPRSFERSWRPRGPRPPKPYGPDRVTDHRGVGAWSAFGVPSLRAQAGRFMEHARR